MRLYNRILIEKYQLKNEILPIKYFSAEEVNLNMKDLYFDDLAKDFSETTEETQVFTACEKTEEDEIRKIST